MDGRGKRQSRFQEEKRNPTLTFFLRDGMGGCSPTTPTRHRGGLSRVLRLGNAVPCPRAAREGCGCAVQDFQATADGIHVAKRGSAGQRSPLRVSATAESSKIAARFALLRLPRRHKQDENPSSRVRPRSVRAAEPAWHLCVRQAAVAFVPCGGERQPAAAALEGTQHQAVIKSAAAHWLAQDHASRTSRSIQCPSKVHLHPRRWNKPLPHVPRDSQPFVRCTNSRRSEMLRSSGQARSKESRNKAAGEKNMDIRVQIDFRAGPI